MAMEKLDELELKEVSGGTGENEPEMKWCEKCGKVTPHNEKGECQLCKLTIQTARYRF